MNRTLTATSPRGDTDVTHRDTTSVRRLGQEASLRQSGGAGPGSSSGFGAMMSALRTNVGMDAPAAQRVSPEQMFDSPSSDPGQRRRDTMRDDYHEGVAREAEALRERRTGIDARKESLAEGHGSDHRMQEVNARAGISSNAATAVGHTLPYGSTGPGSASDFRTGRNEQTTSASSATAGIGDRGDSLVGRFAGKSGPGSEAPSEPATSTTVPALAGAAQGSPAVSLSSAPQSTAAGEIAKFLASTGPSNAESVAAPSAAASGGEARSAARESSENSTSNPKQFEQSAGSQPNAKKTEDAANTPFAQLVRMMRSQAGRQSSARIMLEPPELGRIQVRVKMLGNRVQVGVETETAAARELISGRAEKLKAALEHHGVALDRLDINTNTAGLFDQRQAVGGGSNASAQNGQEPFAEGRSMRPRGSDIRAGVGTPIAGSGVMEWSAGEDSRLDIRV